MSDEDLAIGMVIGFVISAFAVAIVIAVVLPNHIICEQTITSTYTGVLNATETFTATLHSMTNSSIPVGGVCKP